MDKIRAIIDGVEYTPDQFRRDAVRMFDYYRRRDSDYRVEWTAEMFVATIAH